MIKLKDVVEEKPDMLMNTLLKTVLKLGKIILMLTLKEELLPLVIMIKVKLFSKIKELDLLKPIMFKL